MHPVYLKGTLHLPNLSLCRDKRPRKKQQLVHHTSLQRLRLLLAASRLSKHNDKHLPNVVLLLASDVDGGPTVKQHCINALCLFGVMPLSRLSLSFLKKKTN